MDDREACWEVMGGHCGLGRGFRNQGAHACWLELWLGARPSQAMGIHVIALPLML